MKKTCPDLVALSDDALRDFWQRHTPEQLKRLGDRLLAESLPRAEPRLRDFYAEDLAALRQAAGFTIAQASQRLEVTPVILMSWESGEVRPPASLSLIYAQTVK
jgi:DNA-binding transcriptional regulator YiaG